MQAARRDEGVPPGGKSLKAKEEMGQAALQASVLEGEREEVSLEKAEHTRGGGDEKQGGSLGVAGPV